MRPVKAALTVACVLTVLAAVRPADASASNAFISVFSGGFPVGTFQEDAYYIASPGETNNLTVNEIASGVFRLHDSGATITAGFLCQSLDAHTAVCNAKRLAGVNLGDGNDIAALSLHAGQLPSGEEAQPRAFVVGGIGNDTISAATTTPPKPNRSSDFTGPGVFKGTFAVQGGPGNDTIIGSADGDILEGGAGNDQIAGGGGDDVVAGGSGDDRLRGDSGADFVLGGDLTAFDLGVPEPRGRDVLAGGMGSDLLAPSPGSSQIDGGGGRDTLLYARRHSSGHRPPAPVIITFDGRANDGPPGKRDNVAPSVENVISVGSGFFSLAGSIVLKRGDYALTGGTALQATVTVLSHLGTPRADHGIFTGSSFTVHPGPFHAGLTTIRLTGGNFRTCGRSKTLLAHAARHRLRRRLFSNVHGHYRTQTGSSSATVRGTEWITAEFCDGTLTTVLRGSVAVRDFRRHKTVLVPAGKSYMAR